MLIKLLTGIFSQHGLRCLGTLSKEKQNNTWANLLCQKHTLGSKLAHTFSIFKQKALCPPQVTCYHCLQFLANFSGKAKNQIVWHQWKQPSFKTTVRNGVVGMISHHGITVKSLAFLCISVQQCVPQLRLEITVLSYSTGIACSWAVTFKYQNLSLPLKQYHSRTLNLKALCLIWMPVDNADAFPVWTQPRAFRMGKKGERKWAPGDQS